MRSIQFRLPIKTISKSNAYRISGKRLYKTQECRVFEEAVRNAAQSLWKGSPSSAPFRVSIHVGMGDQRRRDLDGCLKSILDALNEVVWKDDKQVFELHITKSIGEPEHYLEICIEELE